MGRATSPLAKRSKVGVRLGVDDLLAQPSGKRANPLPGGHTGDLADTGAMARNGVGHQHVKTTVGGCDGPGESADPCADDTLGLLVYPTFVPSTSGYVNQSEVQVHS